MRQYAGSALMLLVTTAVIVGSYTVNLKVSAERAEVDRLQRLLVADAHSIRDMQAELRTRARPPQIQRWNDDVLMMATPVAGQYLRSPLQLASFAPSASVGPAVRNAVTAPVPMVQQPAPIVRAAFRQPSPPAVGIVAVAFRPPTGPRPGPALGTSPVVAIDVAPLDLIPDTGDQP